MAMVIIREWIRKRTKAYVDRVRVGRSVSETAFRHILPTRRKSQSPDVDYTQTVRFKVSTLPVLGIYASLAFGIRFKTKTKIITLSVWFDGNRLAVLNERVRVSCKHDWCAHKHDVLETKARREFSSSVLVESLHLNSAARNRTLIRVVRTRGENKDR